MGSRIPVQVFVLECGHHHESFIDSKTFEFLCGECPGRQRFKRDTNYPIVAHHQGLDKSLTKDIRKQPKIGANFF